MTWRIHHHWRVAPCRLGTGWATRRRPECPGASDRRVATAACDAITELVDRRGMTYTPVGAEGEWLWCLGGPELIRDLVVATELGEHIGCVDLHLEVCTRHQSFVVFVDGYDLADDGPIELDDSTPVDDLVDRVEAWLDAVLVLPV